jgi:Xaa-Pro dipeptidase
MTTLPRIQKLTQLAGQAGFDCIAIMPGPNMQYFTGLSFHLSERPTVALFPIEGRPALIVPAFEATKTDHSPIDWQLFTYADGQDPLKAFQAAAKALKLEKKTLGVEALRLRVLELYLMQQAAPEVKVDPAEAIIARLRMIKDADEIKAMKRAVEIAEIALENVQDVLKPGLTEQQMAGELLVALMRAGAESFPFEPLVQSGPNSALPHATPGSRVVQSGEILLLDFGVNVDGYASDVTRTFAVGPIGDELKKIYEIVKQANAAGRAAARAGATGQDVDRAARKVIVEAGYGQYFTHRTGHGLGLEGHEPPYMVEGNDVPLEVGNTFTVEPGIYVPGLGGVRIEDDVLITGSGAESLTTYSRDLITIG